MILETVKPRWQSCVVAAPGPSLEFFECHLPLIAVGDAWKILPHADVLYACDPSWWERYDGSFKGELWSTHHLDGNGEGAQPGDKRAAQERWGVRCVRGVRRDTFSMDPSVIHYGDNSGFQAINLAILFGCTRIILAGFDMRGENKVRRDGRDHYERFVKFFDTAAKHLEGVEIINATPESALNCFPKMELKDVLDQVAA